MTSMAPAVRSSRAASNRTQWLPDQRAFYNACRADGFADCADFNHPQGTGIGPVPLNNVDAVRWSTAIAYLNPARHRLNLTIKPQCQVRRVIFDGNRATAVEVRSGGEKFVVEGEEIILSAGAICSPHLLMLSGVGPQDQLRNFGIPVVHHLPGVGQNLRDHPYCNVTWRTRQDFTLDPMAPRMQLVLRCTSSGSLLRNDLQLLMYSYAQQLEMGRFAPVGTRILPAIELAASAGELRLQSSDPDVQPLIDYGYLKDESDRRRMREAIRLAVRLGEHPDFKAITIERIEPTAQELRDDETLDAFAQRNATTCMHISATCKMGPASDPAAVVDQYGRVHGVHSLRVADASIMPDCVRANTNLTTMMIGERIADFIRHRAARCFCRSAGLRAGSFFWIGIERVKKKDAGTEAGAMGREKAQAVKSAGQWAAASLGRRCGGRVGSRGTRKSAHTNSHIIKVKMSL